MLSVKKYSKPTRILHWVSAVFIITLFTLGILMTRILGDNRFALYNIHKIFGMVILCTVVIRFITRLYSVIPPWPIKYSIWERYLSGIVHYALYLFTFLTALSGYVMSSAGGRPPNLWGYKFPIFIAKNASLAKLANELHSIMAYTLLVLITLHILGTIKHAFIDNDKPLQRIL